MLSFKTVLERLTEEESSKSENVLKIMKNSGLFEKKGWNLEIKGKTCVATRTYSDKRPSSVIGIKPHEKNNDIDVYITNENQARHLSTETTIPGRKSLEDTVMAAFKFVKRYGSEVFE